MNATATATMSVKIGFWTRFIAFIIDAIVVGIVSSILAGIVVGDDIGRRSGFNTLVGLAYWLYFWSSYGGGQTLGMRALNIKVVKTDGSQLDLLAAFIRYVGLLLSIIVLFIGLIWVAFDPNKQGWHDKIANTYVVKA